MRENPTEVINVLQNLFYRNNPKFLKCDATVCMLSFDQTMLITMLPSLIACRLTPSLIARTSRIRLYDDPDFS